jgi:hypothetical protein
LAVENIIWVDEVDGLCAATSHIEGCKVVGLDCEWKPSYVKGSKPNKVITDLHFEKKKRISRTCICGLGVGCHYLMDS